MSCGITRFTKSATAGNKRSRSSVSEVTADTSSRKSSSSARSRKGAACFRTVAISANSRLDDLDARAGADPRSPGIRHVLYIVQCANPSGRLDTHVRTYDSAHESHIVRSRARWTEACRSLHEVRSGELR